MTTRKDTVRVFVAVGLSNEAREQLVDAVDRIHGEIPDGIQWARPDGMHLTLKFLGNIPVSRVAPLAECLGPVVAKAQPFPLQLAELGMFPNHRAPRVLWAGTSGDLEALSNLQQAAENAITGLGHQAEERPFRPHITLGRPRRSLSDTRRARIGQAVSELAPPTPVVWKVESVEVMQSELHPSGARYTVLASLDFRAPRP